MMVTWIGDAVKGIIICFCRAYLSDGIDNIRS